jgi:hypothetical protein
MNLSSLLRHGFKWIFVPSFHESIYCLVPSHGLGFGLGSGSDSDPTPLRHSEDRVACEMRQLHTCEEGKQAASRMTR